MWGEEKEGRALTHTHTHTSPSGTDYTTKEEASALPHPPVPTQEHVDILCRL